jgi:hypothetical protein
MSDKSMLMTPPAISPALQQDDVRFRTATAGKDLGVDVHHAKRRLIPTPKTRLGLAGKRLVWIKSLVEVCRPARALATTGAWPQGRHGMEATGCAPTLLNSFGGRMAR